MNHPELHLPALPAGRHYRFHTMVKPGGARCNIDCEYCFYLHKTELLQQEEHARISDTLLEQHIRQYIEAQTGDEVVFSWQGGEPTMLGLPFFERVVALQRQYAKPGQRIENDLQTNGVALNDKWIAFLKENGFHVGLSIDGPRAYHDRYRKTHTGTSTFDMVMRAATLLRNGGVPFAALCVVNRHNALAGREVYRFLVDEVGTWRVQFTPAVEPRSFKQQAPSTIAASLLPRQDSPQTKPGHPLSIVTDWSVDPDEYGQFLCDVWDEWLATDFGRVHVNLFETAVAQSAGMPAQTCTQAQFCGKAVALEHTGDVYSCDHFVYPQYKLGNIADTHLGDLAFSKPQLQFGQAKHETLPDQCRRCEYLKLCWGECPKNRLLKTKDGQPGLNYLCSGLYRFYKHIDSDMVHILRHLGVIK
ncbi:anaerobic sulfatase maturase [Jeongeupia wiesaeckerbachi]|uniref:anaerobic sulfatase maturase n=1 Tax=Jeongeupia wiesaeckerbachi TaxID=3051218 RepID=UPI003D805E6C